MTVWAETHVSPCLVVKKPKGDHKKTSGKKVESSQTENVHRNQGNLEITGPKVASPGPQGRLECSICQFLLSDFTVSVLTKGVFMTADVDHMKR